MSQSSIGSFSDAESVPEESHQQLNTKSADEFGSMFGHQKANSFKSGGDHNFNVSSPSAQSSGRHNRPSKVKTIPQTKSLFYRADAQESESEDDCDEAANQLWGGSVLSYYKMPIDGCQGSKPHLQIKASRETNPDHYQPHDYESHPFHRELHFEDDNSVEDDNSLEF